jgi:hypothetical protein
MERVAADVEAFHLGVADLDAFLVDCCVKDSLASRRPFKISTSPGFVKTVYTDHSFDLGVNAQNTFDPTLGVQRVYWSKNFKPGLNFSNGSLILR